jgi:hypothetical protein
MAIRRVSKSSRFTRSRTPTRKAPPPKPKPKPKPVSRVTRFTPKPTPKPAPKPVVSKPAPKPTTTSSRISRGTVRFTRTPPPKPKPKPVVRTVVRTPPKPAPKPVSRVTRFTPKPPPPPPVVRLPPAKPKPKPIVTPTKTPTKRPRPSTAKPIVVQQPSTVIQTVVKEKPSGKVETTEQNIFQTPTAVQEVESSRERALRIRAEKEQSRAKVPFIAGIPGLIGGAIPLAAGAVSGPIPFQENTPVTTGEKAFKLEGFKAEGEGFLGGAGASKGRAEALDLSEKVLSEETITLPTEQIIETIPGGEPTTEVREFIDPVTGLPTTETKTTIPGDIEIVREKGGSTIKQTLGKSEVKPDFSDPIGSLFAGASQSALNEVIALKNIPGAVTGGKQEEFFATPSSIFFDSTFSAINKLGGEIFDLGRQAAGKKKVEAGQSITTFGGLSSTGFGEQITIDQQERGPSSRQILEVGGERITRIATADPLFAVGDLAVQAGLLAIAPVKAASIAIRGVGAAGKFAKVASKGVGAIKGRGLQSASGQLVTSPKPKTPLSRTFSEEFQASFQVEKAQAPAKAQLKGFSSLSAKDRSKLVKSQRNEFEQAVDTAQTKPKVKGLGIGEETADFVQRRRDAADVARLPKERISPTQLDPSLQKSIKELESGGTDLFKVKEVGFKSTPVSLGKGIVKFPGDEFGDIAGKGGKRPPSGGTGGAKPASGTGFSQDFLNTLSGKPKKSIFDEAGIAFGTSKKGFTGTSVELGTSLVKKTPRIIPKAQIDELAKKTGRTKPSAEKAIREASERGISFDELTTGAGRLILKTKQQTAKIATLQKTKVAKQKKLVEQLKKEKAKATTKAQKATIEKQTQSAFRKLIVAEKAVIAAKATKTATKSDLDILFKKPRKLKGKGTDDVFDTVRTPRGKTTGILGGIATGVAVGAGVGIGLDQEAINKPKVITNPNIFDREISRVVNDPTVQITRTSQQPKQTTRFTPGIVNIFRETQQPRLVTTSIFDQDQVTKQKADKIFTQQIQKQQPIQQIITTTTTPPGFPPTRGGFGFPFDGSRKDEAKETKSQRRFFRLFDVAKTPFGKIEVGLGAQVQSDKPIFEFEDVPLRSGKKRRNLGEDFFSQDFENVFA